MDKKIEAAIRETLVIGNSVSIKRCVDKLKLIFEQEQALRQANVSRCFDGCSTCKNNISGVEAGLWCINNCIAGSKYEAAQNGG